MKTKHTIHAVVTHPTNETQREKIPQFHNISHQQHPTLVKFYETVCTETLNKKTEKTIFSSKNKNKPDEMSRRTVSSRLSAKIPSRKVPPTPTPQKNDDTSSSSSSSPATTTTRSSRKMTQSLPRRSPPPPPPPPSSNITQNVVDSTTKTTSQPPVQRRVPVPRESGAACSCIIS